jgi:hypothetical protein
MGIHTTHNRRSRKRNNANTHNNNIYKKKWGKIGKKQGRKVENARNKNWKLK